MRPEALLRALVHVQAHLDQDLSLERLAGRAGVSPFHFQREFRRAVGETPRAYVERLRLERAAFRLVHHEATVLEIALECGFAGHDVFTRAFRRRFGHTPSEQRRRGLPASGDGHPRAATPAAEFELSRSRVVRTRPQELAFLRHTGAYEDVPATLWDRLLDWSKRHGRPAPDRLLGMGHDAPGLTPADQLRFDAAVSCPAEALPEGEIGRQTLPARDWALTTHSGPYASLTQAHPRIFEQVQALAGVRVIGLPVVEVYRTTHVDPTLAVNHTDVYLPVERIGARP